MVKPFQAIGGITYTAKNKDDVKFEKVTKDGVEYVKIVGNNATVNLPKNAASNIIVDSPVFGTSNNLKIVDGEENNGKKYSDKIIIEDADNVTYDAAIKKDKAGNRVWATNPQGGDVITVKEGKGNIINARSGNTVSVQKDAEDTKVDASQGCSIKDRATSTMITLHGSPNTKANPTSATEINGSSFTTVLMNQNTFAKITNYNEDHDVKVKDLTKNKDITKLDSDSVHYYFVKDDK